jgi:hypothetical protein
MLQLRLQQAAKAPACIPDLHIGCLQNGFYHLLDHSINLCLCSSIQVGGTSNSKNDWWRHHNGECWCCECTPHIHNIEYL